jgi:hypothetical protein
MTLDDRELYSSIDWSTGQRTGLSLGKRIGAKLFGSRDNLYIDGIAKWLRLCNTFECKDPRDKVFALLSMGEPALEVDYSKTADQIATALTASFLRHGQVGFWLGNLLGHKDGSHYPDSDQPGTPPSWSLDLTKRSMLGTGEQPLGKGTEIEGNVATLPTRCFGVIASDIAANSDADSGSFTLVLTRDMLGQDTPIRRPMSSRQASLKPTTSNRVHRQSIIWDRNLYFKPPIHLSMDVYSPSNMARFANLRPNDMLCAFNSLSWGHEWVPVVSIRRTSSQHRGSPCYRIVDVFAGQDFRTSSKEHFHAHNLHHVAGKVSLV